MTDGVTVPRLFLHGEYRRADVVITGYDEAGVYEAKGDRFIIGRTPSSEISIHALIGGHRTFGVMRKDTAWVFHVQNEWAVALIDGQRLEYQPSHRFPRRILADGNVIEVLEVHTGELVHRLRVEIRP